MRFGDFWDAADGYEGEPKLLSIVCRCTDGGSEQQIQAFAKHFEEWQSQIELICIGEPSLEAGWEKSVVKDVPHFACALKPVGIPAVLWDAGILRSKGQWIWFLEMDVLPAREWVQTLLQTISNAGSRCALAFFAQEDPHLPDGVRAVRPPWLDLFYKGFRIPLSNVVMRRTIFEEFGLFDPHLVMRETYAQEFLMRISPFVSLDAVFVKADIPETDFGNFSEFFYHWLGIKRTDLLQASAIRNYPLDHFLLFSEQMPRELAWWAYLNLILPYYRVYRYVWADFAPLQTRSFDWPTRHVTLLKTDYETTFDVWFRNYDLFAQGQRFLKLSYLQATQWHGLQDDALVLFRTVTDECLKIGEQVAKTARPVGYALDDDFLHFHELGDGMADFKPGHAAFDAMVQTIRLADAVICSSEHIERTIHEHNWRTILLNPSLLPALLPSPKQKDNKTQVFKFGYAGGGYRAKEMRFIWPAIERICQEFGERVCFEFWGISEQDLPSQLPQVKVKPFNTSYYAYLAALKEADFDAMLVPHFYDPTPRRGKTPNKLYEITLAQAVGIYSDVPTYQVIKKYQLGELVEETPEAWYQAMRKVLLMPAEEREWFKKRSQAYVREHYSTPAGIPMLEAATESLFFHAATRDFRDEDGRPVVMFVFPVISGTGGGEITFRRRMEDMIKTGIKPVVVVPEWTTNTPDIRNFEKYLAGVGAEMEVAKFRSYVITPQPGDDLSPLSEELESFRRLFKKHRVALVHSIGFTPALGKVCSELDIPHVCANYGIDDRFQWPMGELPYRYCDVVMSDSVRYAKKWASLFRTSWAILRENCPEALFEVGFRRLYADEQRQKRPVLRVGMIGALLRRKCNLEAIEAVIQLIEKGHSIEMVLQGSLNADVDYVQACRSIVRQHHCEDKIIFRSFSSDLEALFSELDVVLIVSDHESFPNVIKEGSAAGTLLVCSHAGGIDELMVDGINCVMVERPTAGAIAESLQRLLQMTDEQRLWIRRNAYHLACQEFHPRKGLSDAFYVYNQAIVTHKTAQVQALEDRTSTPTVSSSLLSKGSISYLPGSTRRVGSKVWYEFVPEKDFWAALDIFVGTHQRKAIGELILQIYAPGGNLVRESVLDLSLVQDNSWVSWEFAPIEHSKGMSFKLCFLLKNIGRSTALSIYEAAMPVSIQQKAWRRISASLRLPSNGQKLVCRASYSRM